MSVKLPSLPLRPTPAGSHPWPDTISLDPNVPLDKKFGYSGISPEMLQSSRHISYGYYKVLHEEDYYVLRKQVYVKGSERRSLYKCYVIVEGLYQHPDANAVLREIIFALNIEPDKFGQLDISEKQNDTNMYIKQRCFKQPDKDDLKAPAFKPLMTKKHMLLFHVLKYSHNHPTPDYYVNRIKYVGPRFRFDLGPLTIVINGAEVQKPAGNWKVVARVFDIPHEKVLRVKRYLESGHYAVEHKEKHYVFQKVCTAQPPAVVFNYIVKLDMSDWLYIKNKNGTVEISPWHSDGTTIINKLFGTSDNLADFNKQIKNDIGYVFVHVDKMSHRFDIRNESLGWGYWQVTSDGLDMEWHEGGTIRLLNWAERYETSRKPTQRH